MKDLYAAITLLALNSDLRTKVKNAARLNVIDTPQHPKLPRLPEQPDLTALGAIKNHFREQGLVLGSYALAEVNRWMATGGAPFIQALTDLGNALSASLGGGSLAIREATGALVADERLLDAFRAMLNLRDEGFIVSDPEQTALRNLFPVGSPASRAAESVFKQGWTTGTCLSAWLVWNGMFHPNI